LDEMDEIKQTFFQECEDLLEALEAGLLVMSEGSGDGETVNEVFRAVHSIKGGAGAFGLDALVHFAHIFETTLDEVRSDRLETTVDLMKVLLRSSDILADLVRSARDAAPSDEAAAQALITELEAFVGATMQEKADEFAKIDFQPLVLDLGVDTEDESGEDSAPEVGVYKIRLRPKKELYANGNETALLLRELAHLGEVDVRCHMSTLPNLDELDPEGAYLAWTIDLTTSEDEAAIREVFEFVESDCDLEIAAHSQAADGCENIAAAPDEPETAPSSIDEPGDAVTVSTPAPAVKNEPSKANAPAPKSTIRVDLEKVDRLINLVGELVINQAMLSEGVSDEGSAQASSFT